MKYDPNKANRWLQETLDPASVDLQRAEAWALLLREALELIKQRSPAKLIDFSVDPEPDIVLLRGNRGGLYSRFFIYGHLTANSLTLSKSSSTPPSTTGGVQGQYDWETDRIRMSGDTDPLETCVKALWPWI